MSGPETRDTRAHRIPAPAPSGPRPTRVPRVAVVGGGVAGLAAATCLAERRVEVVVLERESGLGGRLRGWETTLADGSTATMSRGFHAFFRQYYNLRALLRRVDPGLSSFVQLEDYPLVHRAGHSDRFSGLPTTPPWNAFALAATSRSFPARQLAGVNVPAALQLLDVQLPEVHERIGHRSARELLELIRFPEDARHLAFEVFSRSFFSAPEQLSAAEMAVMFHLYFLGSSEGLCFDVPRSPFPRALWDPWEAHLSGLGAAVYTGTSVCGVGPRGGPGYSVAWERGGNLREEAFDGVVLATDPASLPALVERSPELGDPAWRERVAGVRTAPPFLVSRYWLDRPVRRHRQAFLGTGGHPTLDNISVLDRYEDEAAQWAAHTGGSVVELHAYALPEGCSEQTERDSLWHQAVSVYPELHGARSVDARHELRADCPLFPPGGHGRRCGITTSEPGLVMAGDHVRVDLPVALMERAATSGILAANTLLSGWGQRGHPVWSVPRRGRHAPLRVLARASRGSGSGRRADDRSR